MTRYVVAVKCELYQGAAGIGPSLLMHTATGVYSAPAHAFIAEDDPPQGAFTVGDMVDMSMHRLCGLINRQMLRINQLEADLRAAAAAGYVKPVLPDTRAPERAAPGYKPLDHGPRA